MQHLTFLVLFYILQVNLLKIFYIFVFIFVFIYSFFFFVDQY